MVATSGIVLAEVRQSIDWWWGEPDSAGNGDRFGNGGVSDGLINLWEQEGSLWKRPTDMKVCCVS